jgi:hypothetical protein
MDPRTPWVFTTPDLTANQNANLMRYGNPTPPLSGIATTYKALYRAYLLKEQFRQIFKVRGEAGIALLKGTHAWPVRVASPSPLQTGHWLAASATSWWPQDVDLPTTSMPPL